MRRCSLALSLIFVAIGAIMVSPASAKVYTFKNELGEWRTGCDTNSCYLTLPINLTAQPGDIFDAIHSCTNNEKCVAAIAALVQASGGDGATVVQYAEYYNVAYPIIAGQSNGSEHWIYLSSPTGHVPCGIKWNIYSNNNSTISSTFKHDGSGVVFYADVPNRAFLEGRSWIKAIYEIRFDPTCKMQDNLEVNEVGVVYQNTNDPDRSGVNGTKGER